MDSSQLSTDRSMLARVNVVGVSGSGKSTFARRLASLLDTTYVEMDSLHWDPNWTEVSKEELLARVDSALEADRWVLDGNYSRTRPIKWARATCVVWLDYSLSVALTRVVLRTIRRVFTREELWAGNRESLRMMFSRSSIVLWTLQTHASKRRDLTAAMEDPRWSHIRFIRLRTPNEAEQFLQALG